MPARTNLDNFDWAWDAQWIKRDHSKTMALACRLAIAEQIGRPFITTKGQGVLVWDLFSQSGGGDTCRRDCENSTI